MSRAERKYLNQPGRQQARKPAAKGNRAAAFGRALWYGQVGNLIGTVAALAFPHSAFIIGAIVTAIFAIVGTQTRRNPR